MTVTGEKPAAPLPLGSRVLDLRPDEAVFYKARTGIQDEEELKQHIARVQAAAWEVFPYRCIQNFGFTR